MASKQSASPTTSATISQRGNGATGTDTDDDTLWLRAPTPKSLRAPKAALCLVASLVGASMLAIATYRVDVECRAGACVATEHSLLGETAATFASNGATVEEHEVTGENRKTYTVEVVGHSFPMAGDREEAEDIAAQLKQAGVHDVSWTRYRSWFGGGMLFVVGTLSFVGVVRSRGPATLKLVRDRARDIVTCIEIGRDGKRYQRWSVARTAIEGVRTISSNGDEVTYELVAPGQMLVLKDGRPRVVADFIGVPLLPMR